MIRYAMGKIFYLITTSHIRPVLSLQPLLPLLGHVLKIESKRFLKSFGHILLSLCLSKDFSHLFPTVFIDDESPHSLTTLVGHVVIEFPDVRNSVMDGHIAHDHVGLCIPLHGEVLCQPLVHPERDGDLNPVLHHALRRPAINHIVDHRMHQFMVDNVAKLFIGTFEGDNNPVLEEFCHTANSFGHILVGYVGLLEIVM